MIVNKYPDGSSYVNGVGIGIESSVIKVNSYEDLWHLNQAVDAYYSYFGHIPTITIPNLIDAQADRRFAADQSSGLKLVCKFLNGMKARFKIFHPHNPEVVEALMDNVQIIDNTEFINKVRKLLIIDKFTVDYDSFQQTSVESNLILMSSDAGGFKPLMKLCDAIQWKGEVYSASKSRKYENGQSKLTQIIDREDFDGKNVLIIDDLSIGGGTFKGLATMLRERNVGNLYLAVSHMTIQNLGKDPVTNYFNKVFTTNSKFDSYFCPDKKGEPKTPDNLEIIKLF